MKFLGIDHRKITPRYPQGNGMVEKFNTALGKVVKSAKGLNKPWKQEMNKYLQNYRSSPHMTTEESPAKLLFDRKNFRTRVPKLTVPSTSDKVRTTDLMNKMKIKRAADNKTYIKRSTLKQGDKFSS